RYGGGPGAGGSSARADTGRRAEGHRSAADRGPKPENHGAIDRGRRLAKTSGPRNRGAPKQPKSFSGNRNLRGLQGRKRCEQIELRSSGMPINQNGRCGSPLGKRGSGGIVTCPETPMNRRSARPRTKPWLTKALSRVARRSRVG